MAYDRYTHQVAISKGRLLSMDGDRVAFRYEDYRDNSRIKTQWLDVIRHCLLQSPRSESKSESPVVQRLLALIVKDPYRKPHPFKKLIGDLAGPIYGA